MKTLKQIVLVQTANGLRLPTVNGKLFILLDECNQVADPKQIVPSTAINAHTKAKAYICHPAAFIRIIKQMIAEPHINLFQYLLIKDQYDPQHTITFDEKDIKEALAK